MTTPTKEQKRAHDTVQLNTQAKSDQPFPCALFIHNNNSKLAFTYTHKHTLIHFILPANPPSHSFGDNG